MFDASRMWRRPLIGIWVDQRSRDLSIASALLAPRHEIEAFVQDEPDLRLREGWRADVICPDLDRIATGRAALAYDGTGAFVLVDR